MILNTRSAITVVLLAVSGTVASAAKPVCPPESDVILDAKAAKLFGVIDANHDGKITTAEFLGHAPGRAGAMVRMKHWKQADMNHDGKLSLAEMQTSYRFVAHRDCADRASR